MKTFNDFDDIKNQAIVIVWNDGAVEKMPILDKEQHLLCFRDFLNRSSRLKELCSDCDFSDYSCMSICSTLTNSGACVIRNFNLRDIVNGKYFDLVGLVIALPNEYGSIHQTELLQYLIGNYPEVAMALSRYQGNGLQNINKDTVMEELDMYINSQRVSKS